MLVRRALFESSTSILLFIFLSFLLHFVLCLLLIGWWCAAAATRHFFSVFFSVARTCFYMKFSNGSNCCVHFFFVRHSMFHWSQRGRKLLTIWKSMQCVCVCCVCAAKNCCSLLLVTNQQKHMTFRISQMMHPIMLYGPVTHTRDNYIKKPKNAVTGATSTITHTMKAWCIYKS